MDRHAILAQFDGLNVWSRATSAPHKPLLVVYALGRWFRGETGAVSFREVDPDLTALLGRRPHARRRHGDGAAPPLRRRGARHRASSARGRGRPGELPRRARAARRPDGRPQARTRQWGRYCAGKGIGEDAGRVFLITLLARLRKARTVAGDTPIDSAISAVVHPWRCRSRTWRWRSVRPSRAQAQKSLRRAILPGRGGLFRSGRPSSRGPPASGTGGCRPGRNRSRSRRTWAWGSSRATTGRKESPRHRPYSNRERFRCKESARARD
jgi:hypothetical protein